MADAIASNEVTYVVWDDGLPMVQFGEKPRFARRSQAAEGPLEEGDPNEELAACEEGVGNEEAGSPLNSPQPLEDEEGECLEPDRPKGPPRIGPLFDLPASGAYDTESILATKADSADVLISSDEEQGEATSMREGCEASSSSSKMPFVPAASSRALAVIIYIRVYVYIYIYHIYA